MCLILFGFLTGGPYYDLIGRTGNNVGRKIRGRNVFSMRPSPSSKPPTQKQLYQRMKWTLVTEFISWVTPVLNIGFQDYTSEMSGYNAAVSYNLLHAVTGVSPNYTIDYSKVLFSRGPLSNLSNVTAIAAVAAEVNLTWDSVVYPPFSQADDQVSIVVYNPVAGRFVPFINVASRAAEAFSMTLPAEWSGDVLQLWFMVTNADGNEVGTTLYFGVVTLL